MLSGPELVNTYDDFTVTATFSRAVSSFRIVVSNGTLVSSTETSTNSGVYSIIVSLDADEVILILDTVVDSEGNASNITAELITNYDAGAPLVTLTGPASVDSMAFTVTALFSRRVTGLEAGEIVVANGAVTDLTVSDNGMTYTLTIEPDGNGDVTITIPADAVMNTLGVGNTASNEVTVSYVDTLLSR